MLIGLIADTHGYLSGKVFDIFEKVDHILHDGDIGGDYVLEELREIAPVSAVCGNVDSHSDSSPAIPLRFSGEFAGIKVCMTHGHLLDPSDVDGSAIKLFRAETPRIIVLGHSHTARNEMHDGVALINPGPACRPRLKEVSSVAVLEIVSGDDWTCRFYPL